MDSRKRLIFYFVIAGALAVVAVFAAWLGAENTSQLLFGSQQPILLALIPVLGAAAAGLWASGAPAPKFGPLRGAFLGALAMLTVVSVLGLFRGSSLQDSMMFMLVFMFFGFVFVGWAAMLLGAFTGWLFSRHTKAHSNNSLVPTPETTRHVS